ncbi:MAG: hypothetical protein Q8838_02505 [Candidatus Phytoplasma australasiaticum]|nr:hypothetical protein [Candidatus Phytoplasma australasiaticum]
MFFITTKNYHNKQYYYKKILMYNEDLTTIQDQLHQSNQESKCIDQNIKLKHINLGSFME